MKALRFVRAFTTPKDASTPNEDRWHCSPNGDVCAISDGASVSFDPAPWASILVRAFVEQPAPSSTWLADAAEGYSAGYDRASMEWMQEAAFDKGSFASLLGLVIHKNGRDARAFAVGDSMLAVIDRKGNVRSTFPYERAEQFDDSPSLFSTKAAENALFTDDVLAGAWIDVAAHDKRDIVLLMTDALGKWLLEEPTAERVSALLTLQTNDEFAAFVQAERASGRMRRDDSTLIVVGH